MKRILFSLFLLLLATSAFAQQDFNALLAKLDEQSNFTKADFSAQITVTSRKPAVPDNVFAAQYFRRDTQGKFLLLILKPEINKGQGYLKIDSNIFVYDPSSGKFAKQTGNGNFQDSNAKNSDFQNSTLAKDYKVIASEKAKLGAKNTWLLTLEARNSEVTYPKQKIWVEQSSNLLLQSEDYALDETRKLRTSQFGQYLSVDGKFIPQLVKIEDNIKVGEITVIKLTNPSLSKLDDIVFTQAYLKKENQ